MTKPQPHEFRPGPLPGEFSRWILSLKPGEVTAIPPRFRHIPAKNVSGSHSAIRSAGIKAHFREMAGKRYVYTEKVKKWTPQPESR